MVQKSPDKVYNTFIMCCFSQCAYPKMTMPLGPRLLGLAVPSRSIARCYIIVHEKLSAKDELWRF